MAKKKYDETYQRNAISLVDSGSSKAQVARNLNISYHLICSWCTKYGSGSSSDGYATANQDEVVQLRKQLERAHAELDIFNKSGEYLLMTKQMKYQYISARSRLNQRITYIPTNEGWLYVAVVLDLCTRKIIGLLMRSDMTAELVSDVLERAIARRQLSSGMILHSDRGVQYSSDRYRSIIANHGFIQSMSRKGDCWDNAPMELFFKTLKVGLIYPQKHYLTREEAARSIFEYIEVYYEQAENSLHARIRVTGDLRSQTK